MQIYLIIHVICLIISIAWAAYDYGKTGTELEDGAFFMVLLLAPFVLFIAFFVMLGIKAKVLKENTDK